MSRVTLRSAVRGAVVASHFAVWFGGLVPLGWGVIPAAWLLGPGGRERRVRRAQRALSRASRLFMDSMRWTTLTDFDAARVDLALPDGPCVVVANHPSLVDVLMMLASLGELSVMARRSAYTSPLLGFLQPCCAHIDSGDRSARAGVAAYAAALARLREGGSVLVFPEGTRSPPGELGRFSKGAFRLAAEARVPLVAVSIACDPPALTRGAPVWTYPLPRVRVRIEEVDTVLPGDPRTASPRQMMRDVRARIAARLAVQTARARANLASRDHSG